MGLSMFDPKRNAGSYTAETPPTWARQDTVMSDFWNRYSQQVAFIDKALSAVEGTVFELQGVEETTGNYGPQWIVNVVRTSDSVAGKISFTRSPNRDQKMAVIRDALQDGEVIEARLVSFQNKNGQTGYDFEPVNSIENMNNVPF